MRLLGEDGVQLLLQGNGYDLVRYGHGNTFQIRVALMKPRKVSRHHLVDVGVYAGTFYSSSCGAPDQCYSTTCLGHGRPANIKGCTEAYRSRPDRSSEWRGTW